MQGRINHEQLYTTVRPTYCTVVSRRTHHQSVMCHRLSLMQLQASTALQQRSIEELSRVDGLAYSLLRVTGALVAAHPELFVRLMAPLQSDGMSGRLTTAALRQLEAVVQLRTDDLQLPQQCYEFMGNVALEAAGGAPEASARRAAVDLLSCLATKGAMELKQVQPAVLVSDS